MGLCRLLPLPGVMAVLLVAACGLRTPAVQAMEFDMTYQTKCVMEEISNDVLVFGEYSTFRKDGQTEDSDVDVKVQPHGLASAVLRYH